VVKLARTTGLPVTFTVQIGFVPVHVLPDQLEKIFPWLGVAVKVTDVPETKTSLQSEPQLMPAGLVVRVPDPVTTPVTFTTVAEPLILNAPVGFRLSLMSKVQVPVPEQPLPVQLKT
jgi:hypothetical protein